MIAQKPEMYKLDIFSDRVAKWERTKKQTEIKKRKDNNFFKEKKKKKERQRRVEVESGQEIRGRKEKIGWDFSSFLLLFPISLFSSLF